MESYPAESISFWMQQRAGSETTLDTLDVLYAHHFGGESFQSCVDVDKLALVAQVPTGPAGEIILLSWRMTQRDPSESGIAQASGQEPKLLAQRTVEEILSCFSDTQVAPSFF